MWISGKVSELEPEPEHEFIEVGLGGGESESELVIMGEFNASVLMMPKNNDEEHSHPQQ